MIGEAFGRGQHGGAPTRMTDMAGGEQGGGLGGGARGGSLRAYRGSDPFQVAEAVLQGEDQAIRGQQCVCSTGSGVRGPGLGTDQHQVGPGVVVFRCGDGTYRRCRDPSLQVGHNNTMQINGLGMEPIGGK